MKLAILFDHFGPYHLARLRAAAQHGETLGVEFTGRSREYAWDLADRSGLRLESLQSGEASSPPLAPAQLRAALAASLTAFAPDVVAVPGWSSHGALSALDWCLRCRVPAVVMSESTAHDEIRRPWKEAIKRRLVGLYASALAGGRAHADYLVQLGMATHKISLGYDAVDNVHFAKSEPQQERAGQGFLASARFIEKKNLPGLLRAYARYREITSTDPSSVPPWSLRLLGDGPLRPLLEKLILDLGLQTSVTMPGFKQYDELPGHYASAGAFIHASTTEQWGLVVNEAMASGLPVLVSNRCGCAPDLVVNGLNGFTFDPSDIEAIAQVMKSMATLPENERKVMGSESRRIISQWGPSRFGSGLHEAAVNAMQAGIRTPSWGDRLLLGALIHR